MELNGQKSDDYIYLKLLNEYEYFPEYLSLLKKDDIIRFNVSDLRKTLWKYNVINNWDYFEFIPNTNITKYDITPKSLYKSVIVKKDIDLQLNMQGRDILLIDNTLWEKLNYDKNAEGHLLGLTIGTSAPIVRNNSYLKHTKLIRYDGTEHIGSNVFSLENIVKLSDASTKQMLLKNDINNIDQKLAMLPYSTSKELLPKYDTDNCDEKIIDGYQFGNCEVLTVHLCKGDVINFKSPVYNLLFLNQDWMRFLTSVEPLNEKEQLEHFYNDFKGYISTADRRYFRLHDYIKIHSLIELFEHDIFSSIREKVLNFNNPIGYFESYKYYSDSNYDFDNEGFLRYIYCSNSDFFQEFEFSKIADRISYEEGMKHYMYEKQMDDLQSNNSKKYKKVL